MKSWLKAMVVAVFVAMVANAVLSFVDLRYMYVALLLFVIFVILISLQW